MESAKNITLAAIFAVLIPVIIFLCFALVTGAEYKALTLIFVFALLISGTHVVILGLPTVWLLYKFKKINIWTLICAGFIAGCLPMSIWSWPVDYLYKSGYSYWNGKETVIALEDGVPTLVGWLDYIQGVAFMGAFGVISALSFWWAWRRKNIGAVKP